MSLPCSDGPRRAVLVLDDHRAFTDTLRIALDLHADLHCVAVAHTLADGLALAATTDFDVALVDLQLPDGSGIDAIGRLRELRPHARVVMLTGYPRSAPADRAIAAGAVAFLAKEGALEEILHAIRYADAASPIVTPAARVDRSGGIRLTPREADVLRGLGDGHDARQVARALGISVHTARDHIRAIMAKLGTHTQLDTVVTAGRLGLVDLGGRS